MVLRPGFEPGIYGSKGHHACPDYTTGARAITSLHVILGIYVAPFSTVSCFFSLWATSRPPQLGCLDRAGDLVFKTCEDVAALSPEASAQSMLWSFSLRPLRLRRPSSKALNLIWTLKVPLYGLRSLFQHSSYANLIERSA